ncbi:MAG: glycosyltransferase family 4 protein [Desulfuromonadales bacterium]|nr:glycosyltransferase family 4 protein [Desulfuromonadales bacterium]
MKILTLSNLYPPNAVGGYEALCFDVMQALAANGHEIAVLTSSYGSKREDFAGQKVIRDLTLLAPQDNIYQPFVCSEKERLRIDRDNVELLKQTVAAESPDVIFIWNLHFLDPSFLTAAQDSGVRTVFLLTDNWLMSFCNQGFVTEYFAREVYGLGSDSPGLLTQLWRRFLRPGGGKKQLLRQAFNSLTRDPSETHFFSGSAIFGSQFVLDLYERAGLQFEAHAIIHHGTTPLQSLEGTAPDRSELLAENELRLLFAGRVVDIKGAHTAIEALPAIIKAMPGVQVTLKIVGDDRDRPYVEKLQQQVRSLGLDDVVSFAPVVAENELPALFQSHDIYLFPSLYEPFALTLIHALREGIPTVASDAGGTPEIVSHRETGLLFSTADAADLARQVVVLADSPSLRCAISKQATAIAAGFTFERMVGDVESHLLAVVAARDS